MSKREFWVPAAVLTVCNGSNESLEHPFLRVAAGEGAPLSASTSVALPKLKPGEGLGPIRIFAAVGVPARVSELWIEDGRRWPDWSLQVLEEKAILTTTPVRRVLGGATISAVESPGGAAGLPDLPSLPLLKRLAWSQGTFTPDGKHQITIFMYAPDAAYYIQTSPYCGALAGQIGVGGKRWAFYTSVDGGPPVLAAPIGETGFQGGRGMSVENLPILRTAFMFLGWYGSCANPSLYHIYAYDHATGKIFHPLMRYEDGKEGEPSVARYEFTKDGKLVNTGYMNAGEDAGWHTYTYRWDPRQRMWLFEAHVRSQNG